MSAAGASADAGGSAPTGSGGEEVLVALARLPGGPELLRTAASRPGLALVGGAVRDLLRGRAPRELDVVVDADAAGLARELGAALAADGCEPAATTAHERFGTAVLEWPQGRVDIAERRAESYPAPGALPDVRPGDAHADLARRDFTVNAIAVPLGGPQAGSVMAVEHALADLHAGRLRVLHERSFLDDPTRLLRLARYRARLGFEVEPRTSALAIEAVAANALASVSRARLGTELRLAIGEASALAALAALQELGALAAIDPDLTLDIELAQRALALLPPDGRSDLLLMAVLLHRAVLTDRSELRRRIFTLLDDLEFPAGERERIIRSAGAASLSDAIEQAERPSQLHATLAGEPPEAVALAGALAGEASQVEHAARSWLYSLRDVRLSIGGEDLLAAGISAGPEIGRRLAAALAAKLDGELVGGRAAELAAALKARG
jgi:tRNA nucleotidyltransferase (CCA-adding enzyme)